MWQIFFTNRQVNNYSDVLTSDKEKFLKYQRMLMKKGIFIPPSQFETCFISNQHTKEDINYTIESIHSVLRNLK